jgi:hypothetical protein
MNRLVLPLSLVALSPLTSCATTTPVETPTAPTATNSVASATVRVALADRFGTVLDALAAIPPPEGQPWGAALIGAVDGAHPGFPVRVEIDGAESMTVSLISAADVDWYAREDPRAHNMAIVGWGATGLVMSHPSDTSEALPVDFRAMAQANAWAGGAAREGWLCLLTDGTENASQVLTSLQEAPNAVHYVMVFLDG